MRRLVLFLSFAFVTLGVSAQEAVPDTLAAVHEAAPVHHLRFKGLEVDGDSMTFLDELKFRGMRTVEGSKPPSVRGIFAGVRDCVVSVYGNCGSWDNVWKVSVSVPSREMWMAVKDDYNLFKRFYTEKFGVEPVVCEKLSQRFWEGSGNEKWGFEAGYSVWESAFAFPEGWVQIGIRFDNRDKRLFLRIDYIDRINLLLKEQFEKEDL